ncbi:ABC transporter permease [Natrarchaeobius chitinivorans]|nr:ABC transporter permease subunit [Natrarchaeobius chitinivorans]
MRLFTIYRKTFADLSNPKILLAYLVPFLGFTAFLALGIAPTQDGETVGSTLAQQETWLHETFILMSVFLGVAIPLLALCAVFCAITLATECERGSLRILLSKPVKRWEVLLGTFFAIVSFATLVGLVNLLVTAIMLVEFADINSAAIQGSVFSLLPANLVFAMFGASVVTATGLALAVFTKDRLQTTLGALVIPALYFLFVPVRIFGQDMYENFHLYLFDVSYHFGHVFVVIYRAINGTVPSETKEGLVVFTGVYSPLEDSNPASASFEAVEHVPMELSVLLLTLFTIAAIMAALYRFQRMDV